MQHVADQVGTSAGNLYRSFPSKDAIVEGLCELDQAELAQAFAELMADNRHIMEAVCYGLRKHVLAKPPEKARPLVEIWAEAGRNPRVAAMTRAIDAEVLARLEKLIDAAKASGAASPELDSHFGARFFLTFVAGLFKRIALEADFDPEAETPMAIGVQSAVHRGAAPEPGGDPDDATDPGSSPSRLRRPRLAASGRQAPSRHAPLPRALTDKIAPGKADACPAPADSAAETPRSVEPPAVTIVPATKREFVDRLFVSGTLVAREEAQVAARIDGLAIVELDAEDGDRVKEGQVLARLDRTQLDALMAQNDAATKRADAAIDQARSLIAQSQAQVQFSNADFERARKLEAGVMAASTVEQREMAMKTAQAQLSAAQNALSVSEADRKSRDAERQELRCIIARR